MDVIFSSRLPEEKITIIKVNFGDNSAGKIKFGSLNGGLGGGGNGDNNVWSNVCDAIRFVSMMESMEISQIWHHSRKLQGFLT